MPHVDITNTLGKSRALFNRYTRDLNIYGSTKFLVYNILFSLSVQQAILFM